MKLSTWWAALALWLPLTATAAAQGPQRVVVLPFEGPAHAAVRQHVVHALRKASRVELVSPKLAMGAAKGAGTSLNSPTSFVTVGRALEVAAFVEGDVVRERGRFVATLRVRDASTGQVVKTEPYPRRKPAQFRSIRGNFMRVFGASIMAASVPAATATAQPAPRAEPQARPEPEPQPVPPEPEPQQETPPIFQQDEARADEPAPSEASGRRAALKVDLLPGLLWRTLEYTDADASLRGYETDGPAFVMGGNLEWYPGAHFVDSRWGDLGVEAGASGAIGLDSNDGGETIDTVTWELQGGFLFRIPVNIWEPKIRVGYAKQVFRVDVDPNQVFLPKVNYSALRFGAGCAVEVVEMLELELGLAYLHVLDAGNINSDRYFPNGTAGAIDVDATVAYYFVPWMGLTVGVDWRRYGHDFQADPSFMQVGGQKFAGGAIDRYITLDFGLRFRVPGH